MQSRLAQTQTWRIFAGQAQIRLYKPPLRMDNVRYEAGRDLLVLIGEESITYNDMLGNSLEVPILSRTTVTP